MARLVRKDYQGPEVKEIQTLLMEKDYLTDEEIIGVFDNETFRGVRLLRSQNLDQNGHTADHRSQQEPAAAGLSMYSSRMDKLLGFGHVPDKPTRKLA